MRLGIVLVCVAALASSASAEEPDEARRAEAAVRVDRGIQLYRQENFRDALVEFDAAYRLSPTWQLLIHIGTTQRRLNQYRVARTTLLRYLDEGGTEVSGEARRLVEEELAKIRSFLAVVTVRIDGAAAAVTLDGRTLGQSPLQPLLLDPGKYVLEARRKGEAKRIELNLASGQRETINLTPVPQTGFVRIRTTPPHTNLRIDGSGRVRAPWERSLVTGQHQVTVSLNGYRSEKRTFSIRSGQREDVYVQLDKPWFRKWQWWAVIGGTTALVGTAGTILYIDQTKVLYDHEIRLGQ